MNGFTFAVQHSAHLENRGNLTFSQALRAYADFKEMQAMGKADEMSEPYVLNPQGQRLVMNWEK